MGCLKGICGCYARNSFSTHLGKSFQKFSAACRSCVCRTGYADAAGSRECVGCGQRKKVPERIQWLRRYRMHLASEKVCDCRSASPADYWYNTNRDTILVLGQALGMHADRVADFLYTLTMQNFSRMLRPRGNCSVDCRVPLCSTDPCTLYGSVFDDEGNVRDPFAPGALMGVLKVLQTVLAEGADELADDTTQGIFWHKNCMERLYGEHALYKKFQIYAPNPLDHWQAPYALAPAVPLPSSVRLKQLMNEINRQMGTDIDLASLLSNFDLKTANASRAEQTTIVEMSMNVSKAYSRILASKYELRKDTEKVVQHRESLPPTEVPKKTGTHLYLAEPIPVLMHKPFDPNERETFLRRYPRSLRMNENGEVVNSKNIRRYRRSTIEKLLREARKRSSIHSIVTLTPVASVGIPKRKKNSSQKVK